MNIYTDSILTPEQWAIFKLDAIVDRSVFLSNPTAMKSIIFTMPLLGVALIVLRQNNIIHNDLHGENILLKHTDMCRSYTINGNIFLVKSKQQPVIIDFGESYNPSDFDLELEGAFDIDWDVIRILFSGILTKEDKEKILHADASIIFSSIFENLKNHQIEAGQVIKYFLPMNL